jgi:mRNA (guanine-N7-)-methyltransferase
MSNLIKAQLTNTSWTCAELVDAKSEKKSETTRKRKVSDISYPEFLIYIPDSKVHACVRMHASDSSGLDRKFVFGKGDLEWHVFLGEREVALSINRKFLCSQMSRLKSGHSHGVSLAIRDLMRNALAICRKFPAEAGDLHCPGFLDFASNVRAHYDEKTARHLRQDASRVGALRKYNNLIKSALIERFLPDRTPPGNTSGERNKKKVLDLACGQGQDLLKYRGRDVELWVGVDISSAAVAEAKSRYMESHTARRLDYDAKFIVGNLMEEATFEELSGHSFDVISVQFALHYITHEPEAAESFLQKVAALLKPGGWFIGTLPCGDRFAENMGKAETDGNKNLVFGNDVYKVTIDRDLIGNILAGEDLKDSKRLKEILGERWGVKYSFWLDETIDNQEEFLVPFTVLSEIALAQGLKCELRANFVSAFARFSEKSKIISEFNMRNPHEKLSDDEHECFSFYRVFAFKKI